MHFSNDRTDWRDAIPLARWAYYDLIVIGGPLLLATIAVWGWGGAARWLAVALGVVLVWLVSFFRDPPRRPATDPRLYLAPADGVVSDVTPLESYEFIGGPALRVGIFLSVFNVHINRAARAATVVETHYSPGRHLNALAPESSLANENLWIGLEEADGRRHSIRQIAGLIARRIVCELKPGDTIDAGAKFGMIKFGSRTELVMPADVDVQVRVGDPVRGGLTVIARQ